LHGWIDMVCLTWWALFLILASAIALGFILHFGWHWWLLSGPDHPRRGPSRKP
jgi:hypothetical protein